MKNAVNNTQLPAYWDQQYRQGRHGWDAGAVSTPLKCYFDQLVNKELYILVPGAGFGWEAAYLYDKGFRNTFLLDFSTEAIRTFKINHPEFPVRQIIQTDFFDHFATYDLIVEQTFFSSLQRSDRQKYVQKVSELLREKGKLVGLLFNHEFEFEGPPYGGTEAEYRSYFEQLFELKVFELATNSIKPRRSRELFLIFQKK